MLLFKSMSNPLDLISISHIFRRFDLNLEFLMDLVELGFGMIRSVV